MRVSVIIFDMSGIVKKHLTIMCVSPSLEIQDSNWFFEYICDTIKLLVLM